MQAVELIDLKHRIERGEKLAGVIHGAEAVTRPPKMRVDGQSAPPPRHALPDLIAQFAEFRIAEPLDAEDYADAEDEEDQRRQIPLRIEQHQSEEGEERADGVKQNHRLPLCHSSLQQFVMDVAAVTREERFSAHEPSRQR